MDKQDFRSQLGRVEKMLAQVVGVQKMELMTPEAFVTYAQEQVTKASTEPRAQSTTRLSLLYKSVLYAAVICRDATEKGMTDDESESIKVPVFVADVTALSEQDDKTMTPAQAAATNPAGQSIFENGFIAKKIDELQTLAEELKKQYPGAVADTTTDDAATVATAKSAGAAASDDAEPWPDDLNDLSGETPKPVAKKANAKERGDTWGTDGSAAVDD